jgi:DNA polymerase III subunit delta
VKLAGAEAVRYFSKPNPEKAGILIYGSDAMRVALRRQELIAALLGPNGEAEMRLTRMSGADLRKNEGLALDGMREQGFFPGQRVLFVEEATDTAAPGLTHALKAWRAGDAHIVVTGGELKGKSALKALFEANPLTYAVGLYDDPPSREEIEQLLSRAGLRSIDPQAMTELTALSRAIDPGDFRQTLEKISLYKHGDTTPLTAAEVTLMAPATIDAGVDEVLMAAADGRDADVARLMRRLEGQGVNAVTLCIGAMRHFRVLHGAAVSPDSLQKAWGVPFKAKEAMGRQASRWGERRLEDALRQLIETDMTLRSSSKAPTLAVMERTLLRLAKMAQG